MSPTLTELRPCMDGVIAGVVATCAPDGTPNISFLSQVEFVDAEHVALSFQFFNKTHKNILTQPFASVSVIDPYTGASYLLHLEYQTTETTGPVFARMKAKLSGVASHEGMTGIFRLRGADIYRVLKIDAAPGNYLAPPERRRDLLAALRAYTAEVAQCGELAELIEITLRDIETRFGIEHAMILLLDESAGKLYTVASHGYASSGAGAEIELGRGIIGTAAAERCAIRISFTAPEYSYSRALRESAAHSSLAGQLETAIPFPGLVEPQSQLAVPILGPQGLAGVLYADSDEEMRFGHEEEDALSVVAAQLGTAIAALSLAPAEPESEVTLPRPAMAHGTQSVRIRRYAENDSIFVDDAYLIKGVAGAILWTLLEKFVREGRTEFSNRELRLDPALRLPAVKDNLEARLVLLERRLADRDAPVRLVKTGRGRFSVSVAGTLELEAIPRVPQ